MEAESTTGMSVPTIQMTGVVPAHLFQKCSWKREEVVASTVGDRSDP